MEIRYVRKVVVIFHGDIQHSISHSKQGKKETQVCLMDNGMSFDIFAGKTILDG
jgi:hypothetical protein